MFWSSKGVLELSQAAKECSVEEFLEEIMDAFCDSKAG